MRDSKYSGYGLFGKIEKAQAAELYRRLAHSPFSSLYGSLSWEEDFAETFSWYYLGTKLGISYKVTVLKDGKVVSEYDPAKNPLVMGRYSQLLPIVE